MASQPFRNLKGCKVSPLRPDSVKPSFAQIKKGAPELQSLKECSLFYHIFETCHYFFYFIILLYSINPPDYGPALQMLKGTDMTTLFIFTVLTLEIISNNKKLWSIKFQFCRISAKLRGSKVESEA